MSTVFIDGYAEVTAPLVELTRKDFVKKTAFKMAFGPAQREAFARPKRALTSAPALKYPGILLESSLSLPMRQKQE